MICWDIEESEGIYIHPIVYNPRCIAENEFYIRMNKLEYDIKLVCIAFYNYSIIYNPRYKPR